MDIKMLFKNLQEDEYGILRTDTQMPVSFPEEGNAVCFGLEDRSFWFRHRNNVLAAAVACFPPPPGPILDIGGGNGFVTRRLLDEGFPTILMEPGETGAWNARIRRKLPLVVCSTLEQSGLPKESVAAVGCFDVLEHIEDDTAFIRNIAEILQPGGMLYLAVPAGHWLWSQTDVYSGHYRRYDRRSIMDVVGGEFELLYFTHFFSWLTIPLFLLKALPSRLGLLRKETVFLSETEHGTNSSGLASIMSFLLRGEVPMIQRGRSRRVGTSILAVARKKRRF